MAFNMLFWRNGKKGKKDASTIGRLWYNHQVKDSKTQIYRPYRLVAQIVCVMCQVWTTEYKVNCSSKKLAYQLKYRKSSYLWHNQLTYLFITPPATWFHLWVDTFLRMVEFLCWSIRCMFSEHGMLHVELNALNRILAVGSTLAGCIVLVGKKWVAMQFMNACTLNTSMLSHKAIIWQLFGWYLYYPFLSMGQRWVTIVPMYEYIFKQ
jgi:hypothetical protein